MTQRSPCYSVVYSSLTNTLPNCSNYSSFCHTHLTPNKYFTSLLGPGPLPSLRLILHCCSALLQNVVRNSGVTQCLEEAEQQAEEIVDAHYPLLQIVNSVPFCLFSLYLYPLSAPFLNPLSSSSPPSLLSILCPPKITLRLPYNPLASALRLHGHICSVHCVA